MNRASMLHEELEQAGFDQLKDERRLRIFLQEQSDYF